MKRVQISNKRKRIRVALIVTFSLIVVHFLVGGISAFITSVPPSKHTMFQNATDFQYTINKHNFEILPSREDRFIENLEYIKSINIKFRANGRRYNLFAYEFKCVSGSIDYFANVRGGSRQHDGHDSLFMRHTNIYFTSTFTLFKGNRVFRLEGQDMWGFNNILRLIFSELTKLNN